MTVYTLKKCDMKNNVGDTSSSSLCPKLSNISRFYSFLNIYDLWSILPYSKTQLKLLSWNKVMVNYTINLKQHLIIIIYCTNSNALRIYNLVLLLHRYLLRLFVKYNLILKSNRSEFVLSYIFYQIAHSQRIYKINS